MPAATGFLYRVAVVYSVSGEVCVNVLYMQGRDPSTTAATICAAIDTDWASTLKTVQSTDVKYQKVTAVQVVRFGTQDTAELTLVGVQGTVGGNTDAPQLALNVNNRTGQYGRTRRGRFFLGGVPNSYVDAGRITTTGGTALNTAINAISAAWVGASSTGPAQLGVFSRSRYKIVSNPFDEYWVATTQLAWQGVLSTMRSRKPTT